MQVCITFMLDSEICQYAERHATQQFTHPADIHTISKMAEGLTQQQHMVVLPTTKELQKDSGSCLLL